MKVEYQGLIIEYSRNIQTISDVEIKKDINNHSKLYIKGTVPDDEREKSAIEMSLTDNIKVVRKDNEEDIVFNGSISNVSIRHFGDVYVLELEAISYTYDLDVKRKSRSFQDLNLTYRDVIREVLADYKKANFIDTVAFDAKIDDIIVQYNETDWEFIKRIATHFGACLVDECKKDYPEFYFGLPVRSDLSQLPKYAEIEYKRKKDIKKYVDISNNYNENFHLWDAITYEVEMYEYFDICDRVRLRDEKLVVRSIKSYIVKSELKHIYTLTTENGTYQKFQPNNNIISAKLKGVIKEVSRNSIRVHLDIDKVYKGTNNKFIPYAGGVNNEVAYTMPKIGSEVQMFFRDGEERNAIISGSVRKGSAGHDRMGDHREKHLRNEFGEELRLGVSDLEFKSSDAGDPKKGIVPKKATIVMDNQGVITFTAEDAFDIIADLDINIGEIPPKETPAGWIIVEPGVTENISFTAKEIIIACGVEESGAPSSAMVMDEESYFIIDAPTFAKIDGLDDKAPVQDYSDELAQLAEQDKAELQAARDELSSELKAVQDEAKANFWKGVKSIAIGALCVGFAVATGGVGGIVLGAIGAANLAVGAARTTEGVTSGAAIADGDFSGGENPAVNMMVACGMDEETAKNVFGAIELGVNIAGEIALSIVMPGALAKAGGKLAKVGKVIDKLDSEVGQFIIDTGCNIWDEYNATGRGDINVVKSVAIAGVTAVAGKGAEKGIGAVAKGSKKVMNKADDVIKKAAKNTDTLTGKIAKKADDFTTKAKDTLDHKIKCFFTGEPIDSVRGLLIEEFTDIVLLGIGEDFEIRRYYNSRNRKNGILGVGWSLGISSNVKINEDNDLMEIYLPDNSTERYFKSELGTWENTHSGSEQYKVYENPLNSLISLRTPEKITYEYNKQGNLAAIRDINDNVTSIQYLYETDKIDKIVNTAGQTLRFEYENDRLVKLTDDIGRTVEYTYEGYYLTKVKNINGGIFSFEYQEDGYISTITDANGLKYLYNKYDKIGRVIWQIFGTGKEVFIEYDDVLNRNIFRYPVDNRVEIFDYNEDLLVTKFSEYATITSGDEYVIDYENGSFEEYTFDEWGNKASIQDRNGNITKMEYDIYGNVLVRTFPDGTRESFVYDENNNLIKETKANGQVIERTFDKAGNVLILKEQVDFNNIAITTFEYDSKGRVTSKVDAENNKFEYIYKNEKSVAPSEEILPVGTKILYEYDVLGRKISEQIEKAKTEYSYSSGNKVTKILDPLGNITEMHYNYMNKIVQKIMPNEYDKGDRAKRYYYSYNEFDVLNKTIDPMGSVNKRIVDDYEQVFKEVNPNFYDEATDDGVGIEFEHDIYGNVIKEIHPEGHKKIIRYDHNSNKIEECLHSFDENIVGTTYKYDSLNRLVEEIDVYGNVVRKVEYNEIGKITVETNSNGDSTHFNYNKAGWLVSKYEPKSKSENGETLYNGTFYEYNKLGQVVTEKRCLEYLKLNQRPTNFNEIQYSYNKMGIVHRVTDSTGAKIFYEVDKYGNRTLEHKVINDDVSEITRTTYDLNNRVIEQKKYLEDNVEAITSYEYDKNGNLVKTITPEGHKIIREYNLVDKITKEIIIEKGQEKREKSFEYDKAYNVVKEIDENGNATLREYNLENQVTLVTDREGNFKYHMYTPSGKLEKVIEHEEYSKFNGEGKGTTFVYNEKDELVEKVNALGISEVKLSYNVDGTLASETDAVGVVTEYSYDIGGRLIRKAKLQKQDDNSIFKVVTDQKEYDALDNVTKAIDGEGNVTTYDLDKWGRVSKLHKADGTSEVYIYDKAGNVTKAIDGNGWSFAAQTARPCNQGNGISYIFGKNNKLNKIVDQDKLEEIFKYDKDGNLAYQKDRNGNETHYNYNLLGNILSRKGSDGLSEYYEYNKDGTLDKAMSKGICYTYTYDKEGRQTSKSNNGKKLLEYTLNANGNLIAQKDLSGKVTTYNLDVLGRIKEVFDNGKKVAEYEYNADNTISRLILGKGLINQYKYDINKNISSLKTYVENGSIFTENSYKYDLNGNQIEKVENGIKTTYEYDSIQQISKVSYGNCMKVESFAYDNVGNRLERTTQSGSVVTKEKYSYDNKNRLQVLEKDNTKVTYLYDNQGNTLEEQHQDLTTKETKATTYVYDSFNRNTKVITKDGNTQENYYDSLGLRNSVVRNGVTSNYVFRGTEVSNELDEDNNVKNREIRGYKLLGKDTENTQNFEEKNSINKEPDEQGLRSSSSRSEEFRIVSDSYSNSKLYFYLHNEHSDIVNLVDEENSVKNKYEYDVFGDVTVSEESVENEFKYYEQQLDTTTQLYYLRARYYNPTIGRFTQEDVYRGDGLNLYAYVKNNPVMWVDPSGYLAHQKNKDTFLDNGSRTNWGPEHGKGNVKHNNAIEQELDWAESQGATNITKNKQQVNVSGEKVSTKRPDAAYTIDGQRYNTNYVSNYQLDKHDELVRELENFKNMMNADPDAITSLVFNYDFFDLQ